MYPSRGHWLPCGCPPSVRKCVARGLITPDFPDSRACGAVAWFPPELWVPFPRSRSPASRSPWTTSGGITPYHQLHPLRSVPPFTSPFAPTRVAPSWRPLLSWVSPPLKTATSRTSESSDPPGPGDRTRRFVRRLGDAAPGSSTPQHRVRPHPRSEDPWLDLVGSNPLLWGADRTASRRRLVLS